MTSRRGFLTAVSAGIAALGGCFAQADDDEMIAVPGTGPTPIDTSRCLQVVTGFTLSLDRGESETVNCLYIEDGGRIEMDNDTEIRFN